MTVSRELTQGVRVTHEHRRRLGTANAVADYLNVPKSTVYDWARTSALPGVVRFGRRVRFDMDAIEKWVEAGGDRDEDARF